MIKRAYTLMEMLVVVLILSIFYHLSHFKSVDLDFEAYQFMDDYYFKQAQALSTKQRQHLSYQLSFNSLGNINVGKTLSFKNKKVYVHIGNGSLRYE